MTIIVFVVLFLGAGVFVRAWLEPSDPTAQGSAFRFVPGHFGPRYPYHPPPPPPENQTLSISAPGGRFGEDAWEHPYVPWNGPPLCADDDPLSTADDHLQRCPPTGVAVPLIVRGPFLGSDRYGVAREDRPSQRCPLFPPTTDTATVTVVVHVMSPQHICALAINGTAVVISNWRFRLDRWETNHWHGLPLQGTAVPWMLRVLGPGDYAETVLPRAVAPAPPGTYRVCLQYAEGDEKREACSASFSLPPL